MRDLSAFEASQVEGGNIGEAAASGMAAAGAVGIATYALNITPQTMAARVGLVAGAFVVGVALYYLTD